MNDDDARSAGAGALNLNIYIAKDSSTQHIVIAEAAASRAQRVTRALRHGLEGQAAASLTLRGESCHPNHGNLLALWTKRAILHDYLPSETMDWRARFTRP